MRKNKIKNTIKIATFSALLVFMINHETTFASDKNSMVGGAASSVASVKVIPKMTKNSVALSAVGTANKPSSVVSGEGGAGKGGSGNSGGGDGGGTSGSGGGSGSSGGPACYKWYSAGTAADFAGTLTNSISGYFDTMGDYDKDEGSAEIDAAKFIKSASELVGENPALVKSFEQSLTNGTNVVDVPGSNGEMKQTITSISGADRWVEDYFKYSTGTLGDENTEKFNTGKAYYIVPNSSAAWGSGTTCGERPLGAGVYISYKHMKGEKIDRTTIKQALSSSVSVSLTETGTNNFSAKLTLDDSGITPLVVKDVVWVWTLRVPDEANPTTKTKKLSEAGKPFKSPDSIKSYTTFNVNVSSSSGVQSTGDVLSEFCAGFSAINTMSGSSCSGSTAVVSPSHDLYQTSTDNTVRTLMNGESDSSAIGGFDTSVMNIAQVTKNNSQTDNFNASSFMDAQGGKYVVAVSAIVNGEYEFIMDDGSIRMNMPVGFVSSSGGGTNFTCSQIATELNSLQDVDLSDIAASDTFKEFSGTTCEEVVWKSPRAIASVTALPNGQVMLDGSASTGTYKTTKTISFSGETKDVEECTDPVAKTGCTTKTLGNGFTSNETVQTEYFPIEFYTWDKDARVINQNNGKYEIELNGETFKDNFVIGQLNNGTTYACLAVQTSAPQSNSAGLRTIPSVPVDNKSSVNSTHNKLIHIDKMKNRNAQYVPQCDFIESIEDDRIIHENWGN